MGKIFSSAISLYTQHCIRICWSEFFRKSRDCKCATCFFRTVLANKENGKIRQKQPTAIIEHLALLSVKHSIYLAELFQSLCSARVHGKTTCQTLKIEYRGSTKQEAIFLITKESAVVGQFRVAEEFLQRKNIPFDNWMATDKVRRQVNKQKTQLSSSTLIQDLHHGMKKVNIEAKVLETSTPTRVFTQYGNSAVITNALIGDETGKVKLCLWNEQGEAVSAGDVVQIKNASVSTYKGETQLRLGKAGTVSVLSRTK